MGKARDSEGVGEHGCREVDFGLWKIWLGVTSCNIREWEEVARLSRVLEGDDTVVVGLQESDSQSACKIVQAFLYTIEDKRVGYARARRPSIEALLYLTSTVQIRDALKSHSRPPRYIAVVSLHPESCNLRLRGLLEGPLRCRAFRREAVRCSPDLLEEMALLHLEIIE